MSMQSDARLREFLKLAQNTKVARITGLMDEVADIHKSRLSRKLRDGKSQRPGQIALCLEQNQALRSRLAEIQMTSIRRRLSLENELEVMRNYLVSRYPKGITKLGGTAAEREMRLEHLLDPVNTMVSRLATLEDYTELAVKDLDQAYWSLKTMADAYATEAK